MPATGPKFKLVFCLRLQSHNRSRGHGPGLERQTSLAYHTNPQPRQSLPISSFPCSDLKLIWTLSSAASTVPESLSIALVPEYTERLRTYILPNVSESLRPLGPLRYFSEYSTGYMHMHMYYVSSPAPGPRLHLGTSRETDECRASTCALPINSRQMRSVCPLHRTCTPGGGCHILLQTCTRSRFLPSRRKTSCVIPHRRALEEAMGGGREWGRTRAYRDTDTDHPFWQRPWQA